jgi:hypothetical protein
MLSFHAVDVFPLSFPSHSAEQCLKASFFDFFMAKTLRLTTNPDSRQETANWHLEPGIPENSNAGNL